MRFCFLFLSSVLLAMLAMAREPKVEIIDKTGECIGEAAPKNASTRPLEREFF